jgi:hypothetical protein
MPIQSLCPPRPPSLPFPRGPVSAYLLRHLRDGPGPLPSPPPLWPGSDPLVDDDLHLALYLCYELHYRGLPGVDERWEWEPSLIGARRDLENAFEAALISDAGTAAGPRRDIAAELRAVVAAGNGPSLSRYMVEEGTCQEFAEFAVHRSAYQLKEADPHTWAIPRLSGRAKAAMVEIQCAEYGGGVEHAMHAALFADTMQALGLDPTYGAYLDMIPGVTLATVNLVSLFGLHRRWRGALVGHLAVFEMTSVVPMTRYAEALSRLGAPADARRFYDVHVEADAYHEVLAGTDLIGGLADDEPALAGDILFGARALMTVEDRFARHLLDCWSQRRTSLRHPLRRPTTPTPPLLVALGADLAGTSR